MSHVVDLTGTDFGYLHVIGRDTSKKGDTAHWIYRCKCGIICSKDGKYLRNGHAKSCGCFRKERAAKLVTKKDPAKKPKAEPKKKRATTTAAPGAAPNAASARNANSPASRGGEYLQFEGRIAMGKIMELFYGELGGFQTSMEDDGWSVEFRDEKYPPRVTMDQLTPPLFEMTADGQKENEPACIQVIGTPDLRVVTTGKLQIGKKDLNKYINTAQKLLQLYLHGFMQERKEMEAAQND